MLLLKRVRWCLHESNHRAEKNNLHPSYKRASFFRFNIARSCHIVQICFSYFVVIKKMTVATDTLYHAEATEYDFGDYLGVFVDTHNYVYIAALWLGSGLIYFLDMQIW